MWSKLASSIGRWRNGRNGWGRVRGADGRRRWIEAVDLRPARCVRIASITQLVALLQGEPMPVVDPIEVMCDPAGRHAKRCLDLHSPGFNLADELITRRCWQLMHGVVIQAYAANPLPSTAAWTRLPGGRRVFPSVPPVECIHSAARVRAERRTRKIAPLTSAADAARRTAVRRRPCHPPDTDPVPAAGWKRFPSVAAAGRERYRCVRSTCIAIIRSVSPGASLACMTRLRPIGPTMTSRRGTRTKSTIVRATRSAE
jgi:hypothetical protein